MFDNIGDLLKIAEKEVGKTNRERREMQQQANAPQSPENFSAIRPNAGWLFYKDYYLHKDADGGRRFFQHYFSEIDAEIAVVDGKIKRERVRAEQKKLATEKNQLEQKKPVFFKAKNESLLKCRPSKDDADRFKIVETPLRLVTGDKGLLTGTGISHETSNKGEFILGLQFDYATGLPYLPGSSIKGVLRSLFPGHRRNDHKLGDQYHSLRHKALAHLLGKIWGTDHETTQSELLARTQTYLKDQHAPNNYFELLERQIFDGEAPDFNTETGRQKSNENGTPKYCAVRYTDRDLFFDAYIEKTKGNMLAEDVITPHKKPLQDPIPLSFVKVAADVTFCFQFDLKSSVLLSADDKLKLFSEILKTFGAGAKRRHGFGELK